MTASGWRYYNHAAVPTCAPHETPDLTPVEDGTVFRSDEGRVLFARWSSDWDIGHPTGWWYEIKDTPYDISALSSNHRRTVTRGLKHFDVRVIEPMNYVEDLYRVTLKAFEGWPKKYRPSVTREAFEKNALSWQDSTVFAAFSKEDGVLYGFAVVKEYENYARGSHLRTDPEKEKAGINAAVIYGILDEMKDRLGKGYYFSNGERSVRHETAFQDYMEKYFGFRKAYCKLNVRYRPVVGFAVKVLYPFRKLFKGRSGLGSQVAAVLRMEEIRRGQ